MQTKLVPIGDELGFVIDDELAEKLRLTDKTQVEVTIQVGGIQVQFIRGDEKTDPFQDNGLPTES